MILKRKYPIRFKRTPDEFLKWYFKNKFKKFSGHYLYIYCHKTIYWYWKNSLRYKENRKLNLLLNRQKPT